MKKLVLSLAVLGLFLALASCNKSKNDGTNPQQVSQGVSFSIIPGTNPGGLKSDCFSTTASYAKVWLNVGSTPYNNGNPIQVDIFYLTGVPYTNSIQLPPGTYTVTDFIIYNDNQTPNNTSDDIVLAASPHTGSTYAPYVDHPLTISFTVQAFKKLDQPIDCICYQPSNYTNFGFVFFQLNDITLRMQPFFGDLCTKDFTHYTGSHYANQSSGLQPDMPAIFQIQVLRNGTAMGTFTNDSVGWYGEGRPMKVYYADRAGVTDNFEFRLSVLVKTGGTFSFVYFTSWFISDATRITDPDNNGVIDFSIGYCNPNADYVLPPYLDIPSTCTYQISAFPGTNNGYVNATLGGFTAGTFADMTTGTFPSYCVETDYTINVGNVYNMNVFSSLYPNATGFPTWAQSKPWDKLNWLINHLSWYPGYAMADLQGAIWVLCGWNGNPSESYINYPLSSIGNNMVTGANTNGTGYKVPTGGWACVVFIDQNPTSGTHTQTMFVQVDP